MNYKTIISKLKSHKNPKNIAGMAQFGISAKNTLGVNIPIIRSMAKKIGKDHNLALELWGSKIHEARILASMIDEPSLVGKKQMGHWVRDFDSWDVCDQVCMNLFDKTEFAWTMPFEWSKRQEEFVKRAGFALMAALAFHNKSSDDKKFLKFFPIIKREAADERNFVRKSVNWALRQIGKRNKNLCSQALKLAREIKKENPASKSANWIANDAIRELNEKHFLQNQK
ncbi:DNA alkylation repair protein [Patescibacteria group bacterium]|nr:DNA alkylation repair protein [Patescibacteria group bacterium]MBU4580669.1 DNA alkylation repair protein [Patescibacteria group bacterium]